MKFDATVEVSQFAGHRARLRLLGLFSDGWPALLITDPLVENLPDQTTEPVSGRANGLCVPELRNE